MERPILFNTEMVQAILQGRKSQTRRVVSPQPKSHGRADSRIKIYNRNRDQWELKDTLSTDVFSNLDSFKCPFGEIGDILWVRESWCLTQPYGPEDYFFGYKAGGLFPEIKASDKYDFCSPDIWKPSIHMPKEACRLKLKITAIRVERLQDISQEDSIKEGVEILPGDSNYKNYLYGKHANYAYVKSSKISFMTLWQSINGEQSWKDNPWVWVIEFVKI